MEKQVRVAAEQVYAGWKEDIDYTSLRHHSIGKPRTKASEKYGKLNFNYGIVVGCLRTSLLIKEHEVSNFNFPFAGVRGQVPQGEAARNYSRDSQ